MRHQTYLSTDMKWCGANGVKELPARLSASTTVMSLKFNVARKQGEKHCFRCFLPYINKPNNITASKFVKHYNAKRQRDLSARRCVK